jgi:hypothetical protein
MQLLVNHPQKVQYKMMLVTIMDILIMKFQET